MLYNIHIKGEKAVSIKFTNCYEAVNYAENSIIYPAFAPCAAQQLKMQGIYCNIW